jgi:hypothetical protein
MIDVEPEARDTGCDPLSPICPYCILTVFQYPICNACQFPASVLPIIPRQVEHDGVPAHSHTCRTFVSYWELSNFSELTFGIPVAVTFTIVLELKDGHPPVVPEEDGPIPWVPAMRAHTTSGMSDGAELHAVRAMETGVIDVSRHSARSTLF